MFNLQMSTRPKLKRKKIMNKKFILSIQFLILTMHTEGSFFSKVKDLIPYGNFVVATTLLTAVPVLATKFVGDKMIGRLVGNKKVGGLKEKEIEGPLTLDLLLNNRLHLKSVIDDLKEKGEEFKSKLRQIKQNIFPEQLEQVNNPEAPHIVSKVGVVDLNTLFICSEDANKNKKILKWI